VYDAIKMFAYAGEYRTLIEKVFLMFNVSFVEKKNFAGVVTKG